MCFTPVRIRWHIQTASHYKDLYLVLSPWYGIREVTILTSAFVSLNHSSRSDGQRYNSVNPAFSTRSKPYHPSWQQLKTSANLKLPSSSQLNAQYKTSISFNVLPQFGLHEFSTPMNIKRTATIIINLTQCRGHGSLVIFSTKLSKPPFGYINNEWN